MKALELASQAEKAAGTRLYSDLEEWALGAEIDLRACAKELRLLAAVEKERDALEAENALLEEMNAQLREQNNAVGEACAKYESDLERIKALPPVAWCLGNPEFADSSNVFLANEFTPDGEHENEWTALYALWSKHD